MVGRLGAVQTTVEHSDFITRDREYPHREVHYRRTPSEQGWIRVVVNYRPVPPRGTWVGEVITAFRIDRRDIEEEPLWP
jgi:hypothetical protein